MPVANSSLFIKDFSASNVEVQRGSTLERQIEIKNLDNKAVEVDVWIVTTDKQSEPLLRWCNFSEAIPIHLKAQESQKLTLFFDIPQSTAPGIYNYEILVDTQAQHLDQSPARRPQQLKVVPSTQDAEWVNEPIFTLQPITNSTNPYCLKAGEELAVQVKVKNCSRRVDRYYLTCPELTKAWFKVQYPENNPDAPGLVRETDGLELNPGTTGEILLKLRPPLYTPAGNYFPTLQLTSRNKGDLVLLDVVYLKLLPDLRLDAKLYPTSRKIPTESGFFTVELTNQGNVDRAISLQAYDRANLFSYTPLHSTVNLAPGTTERTQITTKPRQWWRRPLWGKGIELPIQFDLVDSQPTSTSDTLSVPYQSLQGSILWEAHPWWFLLGLILTGLGTAGLLTFLIWSLWLKPHPTPSAKITQFENAVDPITNQKRIYQQGDKAIYLDWQISRLEDIQKVVIIRLDKGAEIDRKSYIFNGAIPSQFQRNGTDGSCKKVDVIGNRWNCKLNCVKGQKLRSNELLTWRHEPYDLST